ncbi:MAG: hypothetical protein [Microvirus sp.]|nr:MAG: hypothetical protein [Microvirus sp.]
MLIKHQYNRDKHEERGEINNMPSLTIPDQTLSIPELIKRYANGQSLGGQVKIPQYEENDILNGRPFASFDLSEQHDIVRNAKNEYQETIDRLRNNKKQSANEVINTTEGSVDKLV